ncbi:MAG TPA: 30S ribosomal protein S18 [Anaerolineae bacterium]|nr:30S ribosomal protein S18 [Anaerolineae bacterium]
MMEKRTERNQGNRRRFQGSRSSRFRSRRRVCVFCADKTKKLDWKKADDLNRFVGDSGEILPRRKNGLCARHQRGMAVAIKRARHLALLPYTNNHIRIMGQD